MPLTIAMTGATGFAGRPAVEALLAGGHRVKALVRDAGKAALPADVELVAGDLDSSDALRTLAEGADVFLHVAGAISALNRAGFFAVNQIGTLNAVSAAKAAGVRRFVYVSSLAAREPLLSPYGASKASAEDIVKGVGLAHVILRPPAVYGPGDRATLPLIKELTQAIAMLPSTSSARFSLLHVEDLARILAEACDGERGGTVELSDGKDGGYSWPELCAIAADHEGRTIRPVFLPRGVVSAVASVSEMIARFRGKPGMVSHGKVAELYHADWVARGEGWGLADPISFPDGLAETLAWYRKQGWLPQARRAGRSTAQNKSETHK
jgi:nucleoside-diphosphate-sugar epimerase